MYKVLKTYRNLQFGSRFLTFIAIGLTVMSIISFIGFLNFRISNIVNSWEDKVYKGVTINGLDVSGLNRDNLKDFLIESFSKDEPNGLVEFRLEDQSLEIPYSEIGVTYNYEKAINEAFDFSKDFNYFEKVNQIFNPTNELKIELSKIFAINDHIDSLHEKLSEKFNVSPINANAYISDGQVVIIDGSNGFEVDKESLIQMISSTDPSSASENGINLATRSTNPKITSEVLGKINGKISSYTTSYKSSSAERATNVELSANAINGTILMPGESFSFNNVVGPRTKERGYKDAAIIIGNVYESGLGGGICQTSSTLHQAVVRAGIIPTQRRNHTLPTSYMPLGFDAAVAWGSLDYVFKNTYNFPILIDVSTSGRNLTISIYGDVTQVNKTYTISTEVYETVAFTTKTINDDTLAKGKQVVDKNGVNGNRVRVYVVAKDKYTGETLEKKLVWNDYYVPQQKVIRVGTK